MKFNDLRNMVVISTADAQELGHIESAFVDTGSQTVVGLRIRSGGIFTHHRALLLQNVQGIGPDAVTVDDPGHLNDQKNFTTLRNAADISDLVGAKIFDTGGTEIGNVSDVEFDAKSGSIERYLLSGNLADRIRHVEKYIPAASIQSLAQGRMVTKDDQPVKSDSR